MPVEDEFQYHNETKWFSLTEEETESVYRAVMSAGFAVIGGVDFKNMEGMEINRLFLTAVIKMKAAEAAAEKAFKAEIPKGGACHAAGVEIPHALATCIVANMMQADDPADFHPHSLAAYPILCFAKLAKALWLVGGLSAAADDDEMAMDFSFYTGGTDLKILAAAKLVKNPRPKRKKTTAATP